MCKVSMSQSVCDGVLGLVVSEVKCCVMCIITLMSKHTSTKPRPTIVSHYTTYVIEKIVTILLRKSELPSMISRR
jgi:hypothetical protein